MSLLVGLGCGSEVVVVEQPSTGGSGGQVSIGGLGGGAVCLFEGYPSDQVQVCDVECQTCVALCDDNCEQAAQSPNDECVLDCSSGCEQTCLGHGVGTIDCNDNCQQTCLGDNCSAVCIESCDQIGTGSANRLACFSKCTQHCEQDCIAFCDDGTCELTCGDGIEPTSCGMGYWSCGGAACPAPP